MCLVTEWKCDFGGGPLGISHNCWAWAIAGGGESKAVTLVLCVFTAALVQLGATPQEVMIKRGTRTNFSRLFILTVSLSSSIFSSAPSNPNCLLPLRLLIWHYIEPCGIEYFFILLLLFRCCAAPLFHFLFPLRFFEARLVLLSSQWFLDSSPGTSAWLVPADVWGAARRVQAYLRDQSPFSEVGRWRQGVQLEEHCDYIIWSWLKKSLAVWEAQLAV